MFAFAFISALLLAVPAYSAPYGAPQTSPQSTPKIDPTLGFTPGHIISPATCTTTYSANLCPARLPSRNMLVTAMHQVVSEATPNTVTLKSHNGLEGGYSMKGEEIRTLAIFSPLPESVRGKLCRFHFITDGGVNLQPREIVDHWTVHALFEGKAVWNETTWATQPQHDEKPVARFQTAANETVRVAPDAGNGEVQGKWSHSFMEGGDFECPIGRDMAWVMRPSGLKPAVEDLEINPAMFVGGQNGMAIEVLGSAGLSGWPELAF
ncbi:hypothetical protein EDC01DRAFT_682400, partial [Geopyxis carbonaria]